MSDFVTAAEKTLSNYHWYAYMYDSSKEDREARAGDLYLKAAYKFQREQNYKDAADSYLKAFEYTQAKELLVHAFQCYLKSDLNLAAEVMPNISKHYTDTDKVAKHQQQLAETYKAETNYKTALIWYQHAADNYTIEERQINCLLQMAQINVDKLKDYKKAALKYEAVADLALESSSLSEFLFKAALCWMHVLDVDQLKKRLNRYADTSTFVSTAEYALLMKLLTVLQKQNISLFNKILEMNALQKYLL